MASPTQYGTAYDHMTEDTVLVMQPYSGVSGIATAVATSVWISPEVRHMTFGADGTYTETVGVTGSIGHLETTAEFVTLSLSTIPRGTSKATAALGINIFRKGTMFKVVSGGPSVKILGHDGELFGAASFLFDANSVFVLMSDVSDRDLETWSSVKLDFKRYPSITSVQFIV